MADSTDTAEREETEETEQTDDATVEEQEAVVDLDAVQDREEAVETLTEEVRRQRDQIEELEDLLLDLSVRVADDRAMGVCPDCHGPVVKRTRWIRRNTIECTRCGRTFHEY
jgi:hypothetical protein